MQIGSGDLIADNGAQLKKHGLICKNRGTRLALPHDRDVREPNEKAN